MRATFGTEIVEVILSTAAIPLDERFDVREDEKEAVASWLEETDVLPIKGLGEDDCESVME